MNGNEWQDWLQGWLKRHPEPSLQQVEAEIAYS